MDASAGWPKMSGEWRTSGWANGETGGYLHTHEKEVSARFVIFCQGNLLKAQGNRVKNSSGDEACDEVVIP